MSKKTTNVVEFNFEDISFEINSDEGVLIASSKSMNFSVGFDCDVPVVRLGGAMNCPSREVLARFLWTAAYLVDSEQRFAEDEYVGRDY